MKEIYDKTKKSVDLIIKHKPNCLEKSRKNTIHLLLVVCLERERKRKRDDKGEKACFLLEGQGMFMNVALLTSVPRGEE